MPAEMRMQKKQHVSKFIPSEKSVKNFGRYVYFFRFPTVAVQTLHPANTPMPGNCRLKGRRNAPVGSRGRRRPLSPTPGQITPCASLCAAQPAQPGGPDAVQQLRRVRGRIGWSGRGEGLPRYAGPYRLAAGLAAPHRHSSPCPHLAAFMPSGHKDSTHSTFQTHYLITRIGSLLFWKYIKRM